MDTLQVRDMDDQLYAYLKARAKRRRRSLSQEVISIIEEHLSSPDKDVYGATQEFLSLAGSWKDARSAEEIVEDIRRARKESPRFGKARGIFD